MKTCKKCGIKKPLEKYCKKKDTLDGCHIYCKECRSEKHKTEYINNKEKHLERTRQYQENNREYF